MWFIDTLHCILCAIESRFKELEQFNLASIDKFSEILSEISKLIHYGRTILFVESFRKITEYVRLYDPHENDKKILEDVFREIVEYFRGGMSFLDYVKLATTANAVDIPMKGYEIKLNELTTVLREDIEWIGINEKEFKNIIGRATKILYLLDNAGEFLIDKLLINELIKHGFKVVVVARQEPYEIDITYDYVRKYLTNVDVVSTGSGYPVFSTEVISKLINKNTIILSKGTANLESYIEKPVGNSVIFLLKIKCEPMARLLNTSKGKPVITVSDHILSKLGIFLDTK